MLVSVIVPVYNVEKYLDECVESVVKQSYKNFELILVDDGSTDSSGDLCDIWSCKDHRIKVIHKNNEGPASARNIGIKIAKGDLLYFVDGDDYIDNNLLEECVKLFEIDTVDIVVFGRTKVLNGRMLDVSDCKNFGMTSNVFALSELLKGNISDYLWNKVYRKKVFENIEIPNGFHFEDLGVMYKLFLNANKILFVSKSLYYYRVNSNSIISKMSEKTLSDLFKMRFIRYTELKDKYPQIAEYSFPLLSVSAIRLYDVSLWCNVDEKALEDAVEFLGANKEKILEKCVNLPRDVNFKLYYFSITLYNFLRKVKHKIGVIVKFLKKVLFSMDNK